ncbi:MAG: glycosyltransferase [Alphaproteobacteria bacterium]|nr:glycosyltransferase [Alphaproteobacteria bacterium]
MQHHSPPARPRSGLRALSARLLDVILYPLDFGVNLLLRRQFTRHQADLFHSLEGLRQHQAQALQQAQNRLRAQASQKLHEAQEHIRQLEAQNALALRANHILLDRVKAYVDQRLLDTTANAERQETSSSLPHISPHSVDVSTTGPLQFRIEGPFETSYSLAIINRHLAFALDEAQPGSVGLWATEGPGDYNPDPDLIAQDPRLPSLWYRGMQAPSSEIVIRNLYPPRVHDMQGKLNLLHFYWEETSLPATYVADFNRSLNGILAPTHFVKKILRDNGVFIPIAVIGVGVDHMKTQELAFYRGNLGKGFRFLHVSSAFERKGLDLLIDAFARSFTRDDDVILIIKTFANPHNRVHELIALARASYDSCPPIHVIEEELSAGQILDLYARCDCFVSATRGEGFGLPMAEAMLQDLPVIVSAATGHADFCTPQTAFIIEHEPQLSRSHMGLSDSLWAEPDLDDLIAHLRKVYLASPEERHIHRDQAKHILLTHFTWSNCAKRIRDFVSALQAHPAQYARRRSALCPLQQGRTSLHSLCRDRHRTKGAFGF